MPRRVTAAEAISAVAELAANSTRFVGIDGPGGAGKTTLAGLLAAGVADLGIGIEVVHVDDFSGPLFDEWDWERLREQLLLPLIAGDRARYQRWDWDRDVGDEWVDVEPGRIVVIEGVSSTRREVGAPWALTIWVDTPSADRRERAIARDGLEAWQTKWVPHWNVTEDAYIERERPQERVDLVVPGIEPGIQLAGTRRNR